MEDERKMKIARQNDKRREDKEGEKNEERNGTGGVEGEQTRRGGGKKG